MRLKNILASVLLISSISFSGCKYSSNPTNPHYTPFVNVRTEETQIDISQYDKILEQLVEAGKPKEDNIEIPEAPLTIPPKHPDFSNKVRKLTI